MLNYLQNKTAIITGASNGIGMEIGRKFLLAGANVVFSDYVKFLLFLYLLLFLYVISKILFKNFYNLL